MDVWRRYRPFEKGEFVLVACDPAAGGGDFCAGQFLSKTKIDVPLVYHSPITATEMTPMIHEELESIYTITGKPPVVAYERNNGGLYDMDRLARLNKLNHYTVFKMPNLGSVDNPDANKLGYDMNTATRPVAISQLKEAVDNELITIYDKPTINELFSFIVNQTSSSWKAQAEVGAHDDLVMSLAIAWQLYQLAKEPTPQYNQEARRILHERAHTRIFSS